MTNEERDEKINYINGKFPYLAKYMNAIVSVVDSTPNAPTPTRVKILMELIDAATDSVCTHNVGHEEVEQGLKFLEAEAEKLTLEELKLIRIVEGFKQANMRAQMLKSASELAEVSGATVKVTVQKDDTAKTTPTPQEKTH